MTGISVGLGGAGFGPGGGGVAQAAFDPATVPGLLWFDADRAEQFTLNGSGVQAWATGGVTLSAATAAARPTRQPGALPGGAAVAFDGADDALGLAVALGQLGLAVLVFKPAAPVTAATTGQTLLRFRQSPDERIVLGSHQGAVAAEVVTLRQNSNVAGLFDDGWALSATTHVLIVRRAPESPYGYEIRLDGYPVTHRLYGTPNGLPMNEILLGAAGAGSFFAGQVAALGLSTSAASNTMRTLERYCAQRWSIPLYLAGTDARLAVALGQSLAQQAFVDHLGSAQAAMRSRLGVPLGLALSVAVGGSSVMKVTNPVDYWWDQDTDGAGPSLTAAVTHVQGAKLKPDFLMVRIGEADSARIGIDFTPAAWRADAVKVLQHFRNAVGLPGLPCFVVAAGRRSGTFANPPGIDLIRAEEDALPASLPNSFLAADIWDLELADTVHLTAAGYAKMSDRVMAYAAGTFGVPGARAALGPRLQSVAAEDAQTLLVALAHDFGTDIAPASAIKGLEVTDAADAVLPTGAITRAGPAAVRIAMASALAPGAVTVHAARHGPVNTLANADLPSVLRDNSPLALPVRPGRVSVLVEAAWMPTDLGARLLGWWSMQGTGTLRDAGPGTSQTGAIPALLAAQPAADWRVVQLNDLSGNNRHAGEPNAAKQPAVANGWLVFAETTGLFIAHDAALNPSNDTWWFAAYEWAHPHVGGADLPIAKGNGDSALGWRWNSFGATPPPGGALTISHRATHAGAAEKIQTIVLFTSATPPNQKGVLWSGFDSGARLMFAGNGANPPGEAVWHPGAVAATAYDTTTPVVLGGANAAVYNTTGRLAELVCVKLPNAGERTQLVDFLRGRWGLA